MKTSRISVLPDALVNLIAAGEIIERPASVVKELVENSLDAGASSIDIEILVGGKKRIVVVDDGIGMSRQDAELALMRHATSKIRKKKDLTEIHTLGFRGEALPSIASVSRFVLFSRERDEDVGTEIAAEGGTIRHVRDAGVPPGTRIIVEDLFFSVPARRKFLKSVKTEYFTIFDVAAKNALSRPDVKFRLMADGREVINALPGTLRSRAGDVFGRRIAQEMEEVACEADGVRVTGLVARPDQNRSTKSNVHLFVNDRPVRDFGIVAAVMRAYAGLIMRGRFPMAALFIQVPFDEVDVNIHPSKREVKFADPQKVGGVVHRGVREALAGMTKVSISLAGGETRAYTGGGAETAQGVVREVGRFYFGDAAPEQALGATGPVDGVAIVPRREPGDLPDETAYLPPIGSAERSVLSNMRLLGQVAGTYIILTDDRGLVVIDQHAAHERVIYERIKEGYRTKSIPTQRLLFPMPLELPNRDREVLEQYLDRINEIGIGMERFGGNTLIVSSIPAAVKDADVTDLVGGIIEQLRAGAAPSGVDETIDRLIKGIACNGSIRAGRELGTAEIEMLVDEIGRTPYAAHCPHGRPTMITIGADEIARRFKRT